MSTPTLSATGASFPKVSGASRDSTGHSHYLNRSCPVCQSSVIRVARRPVDKLVSMFRLVHRYRCSAHTCKWEGNVRYVRVLDFPLFI